MCRQRINRNAVCSSKNYSASKKLHYQYLKDTHDERVRQISGMKIDFSNPTVRHNHLKPYILVFGHRIDLSQEDAVHASRAGMKIYYE